MRLYAYVHVQIAGRTSVDTAVAVTAYVENLVVGNARGYRDVYLFISSYSAVTVTGAAG
jgi:hypothetical protein